MKLSGVQTTKLNAPGSSVILYVGQSHGDGISIEQRRARFGAQPANACVVIKWHRLWQLPRCVDTNRRGNELSNVGKGEFGTLRYCNVQRLFRGGIVEFELVERPGAHARNA